MPKILLVPYRSRRVRRAVLQDGSQIFTNQQTDEDIMAGHSKFKNIMFRKGAQDAKRARKFAKLGREITVASKMGGPDPASNPRLRAAIQEARKLNMPKDRITRALSSESDASNYEEIRYEGYGPGNVAIIIEALTDNRNRTAPEIRTAFSKNGGSLGETNSVAYNFQRVGVIHYAADAAAHDAVFEAALEAGADDVESSEEGHDVYCAPDELHAVLGGLEATLGEAESAKLDWKPSITVPVAEEDKAQALLKLLDVLEENDDVQRVSANFDIPDEVMERLGS